MNINGLNNYSYLFQGMYGSSYGSSSSMASLTNSMLGGSSSNLGVYSSLSDYSLIKTGGYGKLLKSYYNTLASDDERSKVTTSSDILQKLKETKTKDTEETDKTVSESEDGKVVEKTETTQASAKKDVDVLADIFRRNRIISYTNMGGIIKDGVQPTYDYIV